MNQSRLLAKLEGFRKRNSTNHQFINKDLYRLLYDEDIYIIAYTQLSQIMEQKQKEQTVRL